MNSKSSAFASLLQHHRRIVDGVNRRVPCLSVSVALRHRTTSGQPNNATNKLISISNNRPDSHSDVRVHSSQSTVGAGSAVGPDHIEVWRHKERCTMHNTRTHTCTIAHGLESPCPVKARGSGCVDLSRRQTVCPSPVKPVSHLIKKKPQTVHLHNIRILNASLLQERKRFDNNTHAKRLTM